MKFSSSIALLVFTSAVAIATADEKADHLVSMTTLRGGRSHTLRKGRHLKKNKDDTETSQSSDDPPQEGRDIGAGGKKEKKAKKGKKNAKQDFQQTLQTVSGAYSQIMKELGEGKTVLGQGPLGLQPGEVSKEEGSGTFKPETWTPPSSVQQGEEAKDDQDEDSNDALSETPGNMPADGMPEKEDMPDVSTPEKEVGSGMPEKDMGGAPEVSKPEMETEKMPEKDDSDNSIGTVVTTPGVPAEISPPPEVPAVEVGTPANTTPTPPTPPTTGTAGTSSGNAPAQRPVAVGANCDLNVASLVEKEDPGTTTKRCKASCECDESCCVPWTFGSFCAAPHPTREGRASFGGGYVRCMPLAEPSQ